MKTSDTKRFVQMRDAFWQSEIRISQRLNHPDVEERVTAVDIANDVISNFALEMGKIGVEIKDVYEDAECIEVFTDHANHLLRQLYEAEGELESSQRRYTRTSHNICSLKNASSDMDPSALASLLKGQKWSKGVAERTYPKVRARCEELKELILQTEILKYALERGVRRFGVSHDGSKF